jgi:glucose-1-phosphate cytidylyltransferase
VPTDRPTVAILCGGRGTRLQEAAPALPKPLVEIGGRPILWHVMQIYLAQGFRSFLLLTGHRAEQVQDYVEAQSWPEGTKARCLYTGEHTPTGGRLLQSAAVLGGERFCATYADGVADIDLAALLAWHQGHGADATMTVVRPRLQFGIADLNGDGLVRGFVEKPRSEHWVNGGYFCFEPSVLDSLEPDSSLEQDTLAGLARDGRLRAFRHDGFWDCLDTYKDAIELDDLWAAGKAPWKLWG